MKTATGAFALLLLLPIGCEARGPAMRSLYEQGAGDLARFAPECRHPSGAQYMACAKAAEMLEAKDAQAATDLYLENWNRIVFEGKRERPSVDPLLVFAPIQIASSAPDLGA